MKKKKFLIRFSHCDMNVSSAAMADILTQRSEN